MKPERIDLQEQYPCPRCKRGKLQAIILTEAFGCDRCQQIFGLSEDNQTIEQLSTSYPYTKTWQWVAEGWRSKEHGLSANYLPLMLGFISIPLLMVGLSFYARLQWGPAAIVFSIVAFLITAVPSLWLFFYDRAE